MLDFLKNDQIVNTCVIILLLSILAMTFINFFQINNSQQENYCGCNNKIQQNYIQNNVDNNIQNDNSNFIDISSNNDNDNNNRNKLTLYYAMWCGYSKQFLPIWEQVKTIIKNTPNLNTVCVEHDCEHQKQMCQGINGFPSIVLVKKDGTEIKYNRERSVEAILTFVNANK